MAERDAKVPTGKTVARPDVSPKTSDDALRNVLDRIKTSVDPDEIQRLTQELERIVFNKQYLNA